ncbi:MAG TPA: CocE/NonD family hydrolase [Acidimicrobiales bacterium]|nr:CocE/NonD family hydrolase [Acidimicrobiales bacterium]
MTEQLEGAVARHEMVVEIDVPIVMDDGVTLRGDVFRPVGAGAYPVLLSSGPYAKGLSYQSGRRDAWAELVGAHPEILERSSNRYQCWEMPDPERFVPHGYVCVRVDTRGAGRSEGLLDPLSPREIRDLYECVEWAGGAPWSNGRVGLLGVSYLAINQWLVAALQPPHLAAICPWEGGADFYRDLTRHGGILSSFWASWYERRVLPVQHGVGERGPRSDVTGETVAGPQTLDDAELARRRVDLVAELRAHRFDDEYHRSRTPDWSKVEVPLLSCANWGGAGLHSRGNFEGFLRAASRHKWLEVHGGSHFEEFSTDYGVELQRRFFDRFLRDDPHEGEGPERFGDGWRVQLQVRHVDGFTTRREDAWPLERTSWTKSYLDPSARALCDAPPQEPASATYDALGPGITLLAPPADRAVELTGPVAARLHVSTSARDADLFLVLRLFDPSMDEVVFRGAQDHGAPAAQGWLRLSHRALDDAASLPWRPYHGHDVASAVVPGEVYAVDVELWPTSIVVPVGYRIGLTVRGRDYQRVEPESARGVAVEVMNGSGRCVHDDPGDRDDETFAGSVTVHGGARHASHLLLPVVG